MISSCNYEVEQMSQIKKDMHHEIKSFNKEIFGKINQNSDQRYMNYLKASEENLKPSFKDKTIIIYGSKKEKSLIFADCRQNIIEDSNKITIMQDEGAFKFRNILSKKYGIKINKNFDFKNNYKDKQYLF